MRGLFGGRYKDKVVLITGHTGFKGSWLSFWLSKMGAKVIGYSLKPPTNPNHFEYLKCDIVSIIGDIRDDKKLDEVFKKHKPQIVFHLAAQSLVRYSYEHPLQTYDVNVLGTLKVFEACRKYEVSAIINVTSDKAYENKEWIWGYKEDDRMGGYDPYSSSKGCAELLSSSYRNSYFNLDKYKKTHHTLLASCRAGNVIGGGDWAKDRIMSDLILSAISSKKALLRNPKATRPWQHVLEPLSGYLLLGQNLLEEKKEYASAWNFGSNDEDNLQVIELVKKAKKHWKKIDFRLQKNIDESHEANFLKLDSSKAKHLLKWHSVWGCDEAIEKTICWYKNFYEKKETLTSKHLKDYVKDAKKYKLKWAK